jgi:hypothetical protein
MPRGRPVKCIHCGSTDTTSKGARRTKTLGIRKIRRCKSCGRRFTPRNQKPVPYDGSEAPQAKTAKAVQPEASESTQADTSDPVEPGKVVPIDTGTSAPIESEEQGDEHPRFGL